MKYVREIIEWEVALKDSKLPKEQKVKVYDMIEEHHNALVLYDDIGTCPQDEIPLKLHDDVLFFVCP